MGTEHLRSISLLPDAEIAALADTDADALDAACRLARYMGHDPHAFASHHGLLERERALDAIVIAVPTPCHRVVLDDAMTTALPILSEKPLATSREDAWDLVARGRMRAAPVWVAMEHRYMPPVATLIGSVRDGTLGKTHTLSIREHRAAPVPRSGGISGTACRPRGNSGGVMVETFCHVFDLMRLILRSEPVRLYASGARAMTRPGDGGSEEGRENGIDHGFVLVDFDDGSRGALDLCLFAEGGYWQEEIVAVGSDAKIEARVPAPARLWPDRAQREAEIVLSPREKRGPVRLSVPVDQDVLAAGEHHGSTFYQHRAFARMVREGGAPAVSLHDGAMAVAMGLAAETSVRTGRPVAFDWHDAAPSSGAS